MAETFLKLETEQDLQRLVDEEIEESQTLDYKASPSLARDSTRITELCKDVTALANAAGGQLVYGIEEDKATHKPKVLDGGISDTKITNEWIAQTLNTRVQPRIPDPVIKRIQLKTGNYAYVITVQPTQTGIAGSTSSQCRCTTTKFEML